MDLPQRRTLIATLENPDIRTDYLAELGEIVLLADGRSQAEITLRYCPDRLLVEPASWAAYLGLVSTQEADSIEALATTILADANDVLVARWIEVRVTARRTDIERHAVVVGDRQPGWDNPFFIEMLTLREPS